MRVVEKSLTFDDVLLVPAHSTVLPREADLGARVSRSIPLRIPVASSAMDTVTEARLAIALAQEGGIGILQHANNLLFREPLPLHLFSSASSL